MGFTWLVSFCLRPSPWGFLAHESKGIHVKLHRCSAATCFHHGKEEESGHCLLLGMLQPQCRGSIQVALGNRTTHSFSIFHHMATDFPWMAPAIALEFWCPPWLPLGTTWGVNSIEVSIFLCQAGISQGKDFCLFCLQLHLQILDQCLTLNEWHIPYHVSDLAMTFQRHPLPSWLSSPSTVSLFLFLWMRRLRLREN